MHATTLDADCTALRTLLRSLGQIVLQANAITGGCLLVAWLVYDPRLACAASMGAVAANVSAMLAGYREDDTRVGLHGFNGALAGLAAFSFIADNATAAAVAILAATATAWLLAPWSQWLRWLRLTEAGVFSSPCLIVTWCWLPCVASRAGHARETVTHLPGAWEMGHGLLASLAQTAFASGAVSGLIVLAGIAAASRRHAWWALTGAALASSAQLLLGASGHSFDAGMLGFNGALAALALADCGLARTLAGIAVTVLLQTLASHFGLPAMTAPFVLAVWTVKWIGRQRIATLPPDCIAPLSGQKR